MRWALEDTAHVSGYDPFMALALDRASQRWRRPLAWYDRIDITRLLARDPLYWWPRQAVYAAYTLDSQATYFRIRLDRRLSMWTTSAHTRAKMAIGRVIHCRGNLTRKGR
jgi:hypothetical protein